MVSCISPNSEQQNLNSLPPHFEDACFEKIQSISSCICFDEMEDAKEQLAELIVYILTSKEISLTTAERHQLIESVLYSFIDPEHPYSSNRNYREGVMKLSHSERVNGCVRSLGKLFKNHLLDASRNVNAKRLSTKILI